MSRSERATIWIVEDEPEICCLFADLLVEFNDFMVVCVDDAAKVKATDRDIIFLDVHGTKATRLRPNKARVVTMSGDASSKPELPKPFRFKQIESLIMDHIRQRWLRVG